MGSTAVSMMLRKNMWISTQDVDAQYGKFYYSWIREGSTPDVSKMSQLYDCHLTLYVSLKTFIGV